MNLGKFVFAQVMEHLPLHVFHRCVVRYSGEQLGTTRGSPRRSRARRHRV